MADENTETQTQETGGSLLTDGASDKGSTQEPSTDQQKELTPGEKQDAENQEVFYGKDEEESKDKESSSKESGDDKGKDESSKEDSKENNDEDKEFKLEKVENSLLSDADMERIDSYSKEQGLSKEAGQKLVEQMNDSRQEYVDGMQKEFKQQVQNWGNDVKTDKEMGGENFEKSVGFAKDALKKFGTEELISNLDSSGFGSHPEIVRVFARIGKAMGPDNLIHGGAVKQERSMEDVFYGK